MKQTSLIAISPLSGRYQSQLQELQPYCSEFGLMRARLQVEIGWLQLLANTPAIKELPKFNSQTNTVLKKLINDFSTTDAARIKKIEQTTNHDLKAIEYFLRERTTINHEFIHFACTSADINNLAYGLIIKDSRKKCLLPTMQQLLQLLRNLARRFAKQPMLARTHGQAASPTTVGKELAVFAARLTRQLNNFKTIPIFGKINGAVGNFNAHLVAYPNLNWENLAKKFVKSLGLEWNQFTTQIEPHDGVAELCNSLALFNTILLDLCRDLWGYIALGYFKQKTKSHEVGSSVMPHKVNPIEFENAEGNLGIANALLQHFAAKLPISRWQRDLSDSTVMRNLGTSFGHSLLAYKSILKGLNKLELNKEKLNADLEANWQVLAEAVQTVMRKHGIKDSYEQLKKFTRGREITKQQLHSFIDNSKLPNAVKAELKTLTPYSYLGLAPKLAII